LEPSLSAASRNRSPFAPRIFRSHPPSPGRASAQPEERKDEHDHDDQTDEINQTIHFVVNDTARARDSALASAGAELKLANGVVVRIKASSDALIAYVKASDADEAIKLAAAERGISDPTRYRG
jgi:GTP cyclohydrolase III